jgi:hypothetical protein
MLPRVKPLVINKSDINIFAFPGLPIEFRLRTFKKALKILEQFGSYQERWRERPDEASATRREMAG